MPVLLAGATAGALALPLDGAELGGGSPWVQARQASPYRGWAKNASSVWRVCYLLFANLLSRLALPAKTNIVFGQGRGCGT
jgi:hypothetical protein